MSESYEQNRVSNESFSKMSDAFKTLDERFPAKWYGGDSDSFPAYFLKMLETHYNSLCDTEERTDFWRHWCLEQRGELLLPDFEMNNGEYLLRPFIQWIKENVFTHYNIPEALRGLMLGKVWWEVVECKEADEYPQWVMWLESRWGAYQEELGYKKTCALCPEPLEDTHGNNAYPLGKSGDRCCNDCNTEKVLPLRLRL
jgi:hypothetical protein